MDVDLAHLTETERDQIIAVLRRDEDLREKEFERIRKLRNEVKRIKYKGIIKADVDPTNTCARCREPFGWLFNKGSLCPKCSHKVCDKCREFKSEKNWLCVLCFKQKELELLSGNWFYSKFRKSKRNKRTNKVVTGPEMVRASIRRSARSRTNKQLAESSIEKLNSWGADSQRDQKRKKYRLMSVDKRNDSSNEYTNENERENYSSNEFNNQQNQLDENENDRISSEEYTSESGLRDQQNGAPRTASEEVKRSFQNNNASPKSSKSAGSGSMDDAQNSDTQSMESGKSPSRKRADIHDVGFPKESDKQKLMNLIRPKSVSSTSEDEQPQVRVQKVVSHGYSDTDSSSSDDDSGIARKNGPGFNQGDASFRGSMRSTSNFSVVSSEGHLTMVTEQNVSDYDIESLQSAQMDNSSLYGANQVTPKMGRHGNSRQEQAVIHQPNSDNSDPMLDQFSGNTVMVRRVSTKKHQDSVSSDSEDENLTSSVKFPTVSNRPRSRSPSPDPKSRRHRNDSGDSRSNGYLAPRSRLHNSSSVEADQSYTSAESEATYEQSLDQSPASSTVPSIAVTQHDRYEKQPRHSPLPDRRSEISESYDRESQGPFEEDDENIDEAFAAHGGRSQTPSHQSQYSQNTSRQSNLLSPFSESRESIASYYSDAGEHYGNIPITGDIQFGLDYKYKTTVFEIHIKQCRDIAPVDTKRKRSDPYVKAYLLPDKTKSGKRKTRIKKHTLNPVFDEILKFTIQKSELETRTLWLTLWHNDMFGRNDFLGEITMPMDYYDFGDPAPKWYKLNERPPASTNLEGIGGSMSLLTYKGDLILAIKYVTSSNLTVKKGTRQHSHGELHVLIKEARNLTAVRANGTSDPFCKGYLLPDRTKQGKQKTPFIKHDCNPQWNHTFVFEDIALDDLPDRCLELTIWDHDRFTSNDFLGGVRLNLGIGTSAGKEVDWMDARGEEIVIWETMTNRPNSWIDGSLMLRPNMDKRK